ncbi:MAG TPA: hypothetical protein VFH39_02305 [Candidatus Saccharimonadales bacterium]|nr:hypothetical protein [Candidatus Saccharimonadales bacterium]
MEFGFDTSRPPISEAGRTLIEMQRAQAAAAFGIPEEYRPHFIATGERAPDLAEAQQEPEADTQALAEQAAEVADIVTTVVTGGVGARIHARHETAEALEMPAHHFSEQDLVGAFMTHRIAARSL